jgi:hypothetical protein
MRFIVEDGQKKICCELYPVCDFITTSGIEYTKHVQRKHISRNEPGGDNWHPWRSGNMPISDVAGTRDNLSKLGNVRPRLSVKQALARARKIA